MRPGIGKLLRVVYFMVNSLFIPQAYGAVTDAPKSHFIKSVSIQPISPVQAKVRYQLACGETVRGLVLKETRESLALGIIVDRTDKICSSLPAAVTTKIVLKAPRRLKTMVAGDDKRIILGDVSDLVLSSSGLSVSWQDTCRPTVGLVLGVALERSADETSVQTAQLFDSGANRISDCEHDMRRAAITALDLGARRFKRTSKPGHLTDIYMTRVVAPQKITTGSSGELDVVWRKSCHEKPLGLLFAGAEGRDIAVVTIIAPNEPCIGEASVTMSQYRMPGLLLPSSAVLLRKLSTDEAVRLTRRLSSGSTFLPISELGLSRRGSGDRLYASGTPSCSGSAGLVFGRDVYGNLAAALLANDADAMCHVSQKTTGLRVEAPLVAPRVGPSPRIFSLKVFGTAAN